MNFVITPDHLINLDTIAYLERDERSRRIRLVFNAVACSAEGNPTFLDLQLHGADAEMVLSAITRKPEQDPTIP
jgi:hypothetical protein